MRCGTAGDDLLASDGSHKTELREGEKAFLCWESETIASTSGWRSTLIASLLLPASCLTNCFVPFLSSPPTFP